MDASDEVCWVCWMCVILYCELWTLEQSSVTRQTSSGFLWNYRSLRRKVFFSLSEQSRDVAGRDSLSASKTGHSHTEIKSLQLLSS